jgi:hypothetical protein
MDRFTLVIYIVGYPIQTTETGTANRWGTTNSKPPGPIIMHQSKTKSYLLHSSQQCTTLLCHLDQSLCTNQKPNHIYYTLLSSAQHCSAIYQPLQIVWLCWPKAYIFWLFFIQFYFGGSHIEHHWRCSNIGTQLVWNFLKGTHRMKTKPPDTSVAKKTVTTSLGNTINCKQPVFRKYC